MGTLRRSGPWTVPSRIRMQSVMGSVTVRYPYRLAGHRF
jgi:hypothetical protein